MNILIFALCTEAESCVLRGDIDSIIIKWEFRMKFLHFCTCSFFHKLVEILCWNMNYMQFLRDLWLKAARLYISVTNFAKSNDCVLNWGILQFVAFPFCNHERLLVLSIKRFCCYFCWWSLKGYCCFYIIVCKSLSGESYWLVTRCYLATFFFASSYIHTTFASYFFGVFFCIYVHINR